MKFRSIARWENESSLDGLLFFAQRLDELLWDYTLDTYKPMTLNAPYLCREALQVITNIEAGLIDAANLKPVLEELLWSVQTDLVAKSLLDLPIEQYVLLDSEIKLSDQKVRLNALAQTLHPNRYLRKTFDHISEQVKNKEKKLLDASIRTMITTLVNIGVSKRSIQLKNQAFFFNGGGERIDSPKLIKNFLKSIYPFVHECTVYFVVSDLILSVKDSLAPFEIKILESLPGDLAELALRSGFQTDFSECLVAIGPFKSFDAYSAQEKAVSRLDQLSDLFTVFHHQTKIVWRETSLVRQCCADAPFAIKILNSAMEKSFDLRPNKASKELNRLLRNLALRDSKSSFDRFNRVADLHGIAAATDVVDNQLVTLWTAFETLVPTRAGGSKIVSVIEGVLPFLLLSYIRRLVQRFAHDLVKWRPWAAKRILNSVPGVEGPNIFQRALALLIVPENQHIREQLYGELQDFHLLRYRAFQLSEMLKTPAGVKSALESHAKKLRWQIRRIYRTRNLLVHSGRRPTYIKSLVENAHDYLDQTFFDVMKLSCGEYRATTLEQAFELSKIRYKRLSDILLSIEKFDASNCQFLCEGVDALDDIINEPWGADSTQETANSRERRAE
jgi:hypothetical protein